MDHAEAVAIGGGQSGAAAAHALVRAGLKPVALEASDPGGGRRPSDRLRRPPAGRHPRGPARDSGPARRRRVHGRPGGRRATVGAGGRRLGQLRPPAPP
ncbi:NAD(P)-binding protein [Streptomyces erythrochromogenes]|uniref:NAD(P)-binding protein n=1 Tax=Streptomyces erythrochromogenes TaxID=285574 RepID=UPI00338F4E68